MVVGKNHSDIYTFLNEFQKEQADYETLITELSLGRKVKAPQKKKWETLNAKFMSVASKEENRTIEYLTLLANTITLDKFNLMNKNMFLENRII